MARDDQNRNMASFIEVQKHLSGVDYPASKDELISAAQDHDAPDDVLNVLRGLDDRNDDSPADVSKALGGAARSRGG